MLDLWCRLFKRTVDACWVCASRHFFPFYLDLTLPAGEAWYLSNKIRWLSPLLMIHCHECRRGATCKLMQARVLKACVHKHVERTDSSDAKFMISYLVLFEINRVITVTVTPFCIYIYIERDFFPFLADTQFGND